MYLIEIALSYEYNLEPDDLHHFETSWESHPKDSRHLLNWNMYRVLKNRKQQFLQACSSFGVEEIGS